MKIRIILIGIISITTFSFSIPKTTDAPTVFGNSSKNIKKNGEETYSSLKVKYILSSKEFIYCVKRARDKDALLDCKDDIIKKIKTKEKEKKKDDEEW